MDLERIEALLELLSTQKIAEFSYEDEAMSISVRLGGAAAPPAPVAAPQPAAPQPAAPAEEPAEEPGVVALSSPMPGTFYRASSPEAAPYVALGDTVKKGQVLCIVEAMKMMNEIESEVNGTVVAILVDNAKPVQFGQPLFKIKTSG